MGRYREYLVAARKNRRRNIKFGESFGYKLYYWLTLPIVLALVGIYNGTGWLLDKMNGARCDACNDIGYMFMWPLDRDRDLEDDQWCECIVGRAVKERDEYQRMRDSRKSSDDDSGASPS